MTDLERMSREWQDMWTFKIEDGEIHLGKPELDVGQRLLVIDKGCRYAVEG